MKIIPVFYLEIATSFGRGFGFGGLLSPAVSAPFSSSNSQMLGTVRLAGSRAHAEFLSDCLVSLSDRVA